MRTLIARRRRRHRDRQYQPYYRRHWYHQEGRRHPYRERRHHSYHRDRGLGLRQVCRDSLSMSPRVGIFLGLRNLLNQLVDIGLSGEQVTLCAVYAVTAGAVKEQVHQFIESNLSCVVSEELSVLVDRTFVLVELVDKFYDVGMASDHESFQVVGVLSRDEPVEEVGKA